MMSDDAQAAAALVAAAMKARHPDQRGQFLRQLIAHAAAGLSLIEGERVASEAMYRTGDAVIARGA
jgi:hypothetical protein